VQRLPRIATLALATLVASACPERRETPVPPGRRPPQATLATVAASDGPDVLSLPRPDGPEFFGLYLLGKKAGWSRTELVREQRGNRAVMVARSDMTMSATVGGRPVERTIREERVYEARPAGALIAFRSEWSGDGGERKVVGTCAAAACRFDEITPTGVQHRSIDGVTETIEEGDSVRLAAVRRSVVRGRELDLDKMRVREVETTFRKRDVIAGGGVQTPVSVVTVWRQEVSERIVEEYRVADDGRLLELRMGEALVMRPETEASAKQLDRIDLFAMARVPLPRSLPRDVPTSITYRMTGLPASFQTPDARQRFAPAGDGAVLLTVTARNPAAMDPAKDTPLARAGDGAGPDDLAPTPQADFDDPAVARLARETVGDARTTYAAALRLSDEVYKRLVKSYGTSHDRASDVLRAGNGDCTEHTILLVAMARAVGIPARPVHGVVYARYADGVDALYWHAWVEVRSAGEWIAVDPTFGQPVADATHVLLGRGLQQDAVGLLGTLAVKSVDVSRPAAAPTGAKENRK